MVVCGRRGMPRRQTRLPLVELDSGRTYSLTGRTDRGMPSRERKGREGWRGEEEGGGDDDDDDVKWRSAECDLDEGEGRRQAKACRGGSGGRRRVEDWMSGTESFVDRSRVQEVVNIGGGGVQEVV
ncbi:unnamed protein product [Calypogeia fissa]